VLLEAHASRWVVPHANLVSLSPIEHRPLRKFLDFRFECVYMRLVLALLDMLLFGLVYVTWDLRGFFAWEARLFVANRSTSQKGESHRIIKRQTYVGCFQEPDISLSEGSNALGPLRTALHSPRRASAVAWASTSQACVSASSALRWCNAARAASCSLRRCACSKRSADRLCVIDMEVAASVSGAVLLNLNTPMRFTPDI
jgi:hypothetical protein